MQHAQYVRLYADESGESHFEELELPLSPIDFAPPAAPLNVAEILGEKDTLILAIVLAA